MQSQGGDVIESWQIANEIHTQHKWISAPHVGYLSVLALPVLDIAQAFQGWLHDSW
jgi:hypothetical protein